jgi:hypothetical protein
MKTRLLTFFLLSLMFFSLIRPAQADSRTFGTLAGTGAGFVVANNVHGVSPWVAAPVGAVAGNYIASRYNHNDHRSYPYNSSHYNLSSYDEGFGYTAGYYPVPNLARSSTSSRRPKPAKTVRAMPVVDLQPGVDLIKVSILNSNGIRTDVPILRIKDKFIGPQGEEYASLPTAEALSKAYGM